MTKTEGSVVYDVSPGSKVVVETANENIEGLFDGWFRTDSTGEWNGCQVVEVAYQSDGPAKTNLRWIPIEDIVEVHS